MNCKPYCRLLRIGPNDAMAAVRSDVNVIASGERSRLSLVFKTQLRAAAEKDHPLVPILVVPEIRRTRLSRRSDPLDPKIGSGQEAVHQLFGEFPSR